MPGIKDNKFYYSETFCFSAALNFLLKARIFCPSTYIFSTCAVPGVYRRKLTYIWGMFAYYNTIKALHLIFVVTWFAGLFYIPRLFIYQLEAHLEAEESKRHTLPLLKLMTKRLWSIITAPSAVLATGFAVWLLVLNPALLSQGWMHAKLGFVVLLWAYHLKCRGIMKQLQADQLVYTPQWMRLWNEGATVLLFAIVFAVILRNAFDALYALVGLIVLVVFLMWGIKAYKNYRARHPNA